MNPGRKDIEQKFEVTAAYDLISDPAKRARFDRGEIDGQDKAQLWRRAWRLSGSTRRAETAIPSASARAVMARARAALRTCSRNFSMPRGAAARGFLRTKKRRGHSYTLPVPFLEACLGGKKRITLQGGKDHRCDGTPTQRDRAQTAPQRPWAKSAGGAGDALIELKVEPRRSSAARNAIHLDVPISLPEALQGGPITVPTLSGSVSLKLPKGANTGTVMRLKGKGVPAPHKGEAGDLL